MELKDYFRILRRNWIVVVACALIGLFTAGVATFLVQPTYKAETKLFVALQNSSTVSELQQGNVFTQARVQSYVKTVNTPVVLQPVIDNLGLEVTPAALAASISASSDVNTVLITITVSQGSPVQAAAIAQAVGNSLINAVDELERPSQGGTSPVKLSVVAPATAPANPAAPDTKMNLALGIFLGLVAGVGFALLRAV